MGLSTYSELQATIAAFLDRDDLTSNIPDFITLAEARMNRDIRHWEMEARSTATFDEQYEGLPSDWLELIRVTLTNDRHLDVISQAKMAEYREANENTAGKPRFYALSASQIELLPTPDDDYAATLIYYKRIPSLSVSTTSNWLLQHSPDAYLYCSLMQTAPFLVEDERLPVWAELYRSARDAINAESRKAKSSGVGLVMRGKLLPNRH